MCSLASFSSCTISTIKDFFVQTYIHIAFVIMLSAPSSIKKKCVIPSSVSRFCTRRVAAES